MPIIQKKKKSLNKEGGKNINKTFKNVEYASLDRKAITLLRIVLS